MLALSVSERLAGPSELWDDPLPNPLEEEVTDVADDADFNTREPMNGTRRLSPEPFLAEPLHN